MTHNYEIAHTAPDEPPTQTTIETLIDQRGINMVDLMMWLVIAALLLAAALQSIGYYQKTAHLYQMKAEADVVASRIMAEHATNGGLDGPLIDSVVASENAARPNDNIVVSWGVNSGAAMASPAADNGIQLVSSATAAISPSAYYLRVSEKNVKDNDVVYFLDSTTNYASGVHVIKKDALGAYYGPPEGSSFGGGKCYAGQWKATYYSSFNFASAPVVDECQNGDGIDRQFGEGKPHTAIPEDYFSVSWEKEISVSKGGNYTFTARGDDQVWVYLDDAQIMSVVYTAGSQSATVNVPAGNHKLKVAMTDGVRNAYAQFSYGPAA